MRTVIYRNKRNESKYLEVHYYECGHQRVRQYLDWGNVRNYTGGSIRQAKTGRGLLKRWRKAWLNQVLEDYSEVEA